MSSPDLTITNVRAWPVDIPLTDDFTISKGSIVTACNVFVSIVLRSGVVGFGEAAPFTRLTGEDQSGTLDAVKNLESILLGQSVGSWRRLAAQMDEAAPDHPAARCALEIAILDALCRASGMPMSKFFGGALDGPFETDITLPMLGKVKCLQLAEHWHKRGFSLFKVKVGGSLDADLDTVRTIANCYTDASFVIDANQGFSYGETIALIDALLKSRVNVRMIEQPVDKDDIDAMARLVKDGPEVPICADEAVASRDDAVCVLHAHAADIINIKIMKCGVVEALDIAALARAHDVHVMFGGMVETRLAMGCSLAIAAGLGSVHTLDLDTPLLMTNDPVEGGFRYDGPMMHLSDQAGHGATPRIIP